MWWYVMQCCVLLQGLVICFLILWYVCSVRLLNSRQGSIEHQSEQVSYKGWWVFRSCRRLLCFILLLFPVSMSPSPIRSPSSSSSCVKLDLARRRSGDDVSKGWLWVPTFGSILQPSCWGILPSILPKSRHADSCRSVRERAFPCGSVALRNVREGCVQAGQAYESISWWIRGLVFGLHGRVIATRG